MNILKKREIWGAYILILVVFVDQWTKKIIANYPVGKIKECFSLFNITHTKNTGAAFSFLAGTNDFIRISFLIILPVLIIGFVAFYAYKQKKEPLRFYALTLILAGAIGNLIDRILYGSVIDFLDFHYKMYHYPTFNVADIAVSGGVILLLIKSIQDSKREKKAKLLKSTEK